MRRLHMARKSLKKFRRRHMLSSIKKNSKPVNNTPRSCRGTQQLAASFHKEDGADDDDNDTHTGVSSARSSSLTQLRRKLQVISQSCTLVSVSRSALPDLSVHTAVFVYLCLYIQPCQQRLHININKCNTCLRYT